ncbi:unnamed protein product [Polarella glacialis]|uniref:WW domain-containing protein n=1 Tax=Polarella glacialis TaxID=89957 RepID=A0A813IP30_POLGL|nr:unnamed protein product [Polarella glacialis]
MAQQRGAMTGTKRAAAAVPWEAVPRRGRGRPPKALAVSQEANSFFSRLQPGDSRTGSAGVLLVAEELQALRVLLHFGQPDFTTRHDTQQLLALPCPLCRPRALQTAAEALDPRLCELAEKLRPDQGKKAAELRDEGLRLVLGQMGTDLWRLEGHCCLSSLSLPFGQEEIQACRSDEEKGWKQDCCNQIDLLATATGAHQPGEASPVATASRALRESCRVSVSDSFWDEEFQLAIRRSLGVGIPLRVTDIRGAQVVVLLLPGAASISVTPEGLLCFSEALQDSLNSTATGADLEQKALPPGWFCATSRSSGKVYYYNENTQEATFECPAVDPPLPEGWTKQVSKSTGRVYYFHAERNLSTFDLPAP